MFLLFFGSGHAAPPDVVTSGAPLAYTENGPATAVDSALSLTEPDTDLIHGASAQVTGSYVNGEDVLAFSPAGGVSGSFDASTGAITMTGDADAATYEAVLRSITYVNTSDNPSTATRTVTFIVADVNSENGSNTRDITVAASDDPLQVTMTAGSLSYTEGNGAVAADTNLTVADPDSTITGATVQVTGNYVSGEDTLGFTNQLGITGAWDPGTGTLTLSGSTTPANYQTALRTVTYANGSENPSNAPRTLTYTVIEAGGSVGGTRVVAITAVNDPPDPGGDTTVDAPGGGAVSIPEDTPAPGAANVRLTVPTLTDVEGPPPNQVRITSVTGGALTQADGSTIGLGAGGSLLSLTGGGVDLRFTPTANRDVDATFTYLVVDGANAGVNSTASNATIPITPVNDAPVLTASGGSAAFLENGAAVAVDPGTTVSDIDDTNLEGATLQLTGNYASGEDTLAFANQGGITGSWDASTGTLTLSGSASLAAYQAALRSVTYANGSENPAALTRTVSITVDDGTDPSATRTRSVTVTAVNDAPTLGTSGGAATYTENAPAITVDTGVALADADSANLAGATVAITANYVSGEDVLAFADQSGISGSWDASTGTLTLSGAATVAQYQTALRSITYIDTQDDPSTAARTLTYVVTDGTDASAPATRTVTITPINDPPVLNVGGGGITYTENDAPTAIAPALTIGDLDSASLAGATLQVAANYWNGEDVLGFVDQSGITGAWDTSAGTLTLSGTATVAQYQAALRTVTYVDTSDDPSVALRSVTIVVVDGADTSNLGTRTVSVVPVNDAPTIGLAGSTLTFTEGDAPAPVDGSLTVTELDDPSITRAEVQIASGYEPDEESISVSTAAGVTVDWDAETGTLALTGAASPTTYETILRTVEFHNGSDDPTGGNRVVGFRLDDGAGFGPVATRTVAVVPVDDPPVARNDEATVLEGSHVIVDVLDNDTDRDDSDLHVTSVDQPDDGTAAITNGKLDVTPDVSFVGPMQFGYTATAGGLDDVATVTVHVHASADLSTTVTAGPTPSYAGGTVSAFATVSNAGPGEATGTEVVVDMGGATVLTAKTAGGSCHRSGDTARCSVPDLAKRGSALVAVTARPFAAGTMVVRASASSNATDTDPHDDSAVAAVTVVPAPGIVAPPPTTPTSPPVTSPPIAFPSPRRGTGRSGGSSATTSTTQPVEPPSTTTTTAPRNASTTTTTVRGNDRDGAGSSVPPATGPPSKTDTQGADDGNAPLGPGLVIVLVVTGAVALIAFRRVIGVR
jgi:hypothetical protein